MLRDEPPSSGAPAIEVDGLRKSYGDEPALEELSFRVDPGRIVGLIGPDGGGKTTAIRIVCGLLRPDAGTARVMGFDGVKERRRVKSVLGYMPQRFSLYGDLTVAENLRFFADLFGVAPAERRRLEERLLRFSRLDAFRDRRAADLSGGMKQKLALSCSLIHTPAALVLDEPTTGVDPVSRAEFWTIVEELTRDGMAVLVSTPYMDEATKLDHVILMHRGRALAEGTPDEVRRGFPRHLVEVRGADLAAARTNLLPLRDRGVDIHRFGDRLHVVHGDDLSPDDLRRRVAGLDVEIAPVAPTIEDVFVERVQREAAS
ncbi:ABC transporter ATP-binding protein [bacterium]|nr:ABC transporter ATP-binding protein [bacterium]